MSLLKPSPSFPSPVLPASGVADTATDALGFDESLGEFSSTAYGPPWNAINGTGVTAGGTDLRGAAGRGKYIIAIDPNELKMGSKYKIRPNPFNDDNIEFLADDTGGAIQGKQIDFFDWRGRASQLAWGTKTVEVFESKGGLPGPSDVVGGALDVVDFVADFVGTVLDFRKLGELLSKAFVWFIRTIAKAFWDYALGPLVHWNERAIFYYWETFFGTRNRDKKQDNAYYRNAGVVTLIFWSFGYGILWHRPDAKRADKPRDTILGQAFRSGQGQVARRHVVKDKKKDEKTPDKPEPVKSTASIVRTRELSVTRRRPIRVSGTRERKEVDREHGNIPTTTSA